MKEGQIEDIPKEGQNKGSIYQRIKIKLWEDKKKNRKNDQKIQERSDKSIVALNYS